MWKEKTKLSGTLSEKIKQVFLKNIGASTLAEVNEWFKRSYANNWRIDNIREAVDLALKFKDQPVRIIGDYDVDGVTATSILYLTLKQCGFKHLSFRIPRRFSEGFGINVKIIDEIDEGLIITCDNGVAQLEAINKAKEKGLTVIIIDHHQPISENGVSILPDADLIIDPNAIPGSADFNGYCGVGLAYRFAKEMLAVEAKLSFHHCLIGLAALGTVADVMELRQENYVIVKNGMKMLMKPECLTQGLGTLINATVGNSITATDIGFKIGPVINAASRMQDDGATEVVNLLIYNGDYPTAVRMTQKLVDLNTRRKACKYEALRKVDQIIADECLYGNVPLIVRIDGTPEGVIGIIAGNLCEKYKIPAIVLTQSEPGVLKGSARSCGNCDIKAKLDIVNLKSDSLIKYGGHEGAAGLSVKESLFNEFCETLYDELKDFENPEADAEPAYDIQINVSDIKDAISELKKYEPWGNGVEAPMFEVKGFEVIPYLGKYFTNMGDNGSIVKLSGNGVEAIGFDMKERFAEIEKIHKVNLLGTLSENHFNGKVTNQIQFTDFTLQDKEMVETPLAGMIKEMASKKISA